MRAARIELPATPASAARARAHVAAAIADSPRLADAQQVVTEFVAETISQGAHGEIVLTVEHEPGRARITLESTEHGAPGSDPQPDDPADSTAGGAPYPGLVIAHAAADAVGHRLTSATGASSMWAEFTWTAP